jgi:hypothetical protein
MAAAVFLMYVSYGRPGEVLALTTTHVIPPIEALGPAGKFWTVNFHPREFEVRSKTRIFDDGVVLNGDHSETINLVMQQLTASRVQNQRLFDFSLHDLALAVRKAQEDLNMPVRPLYSLRHSGPAHDFLYKTRSLPEIKKRGRWLSENSVRRYEKSGRTSALVSRLPLPLVNHLIRCRDFAKGLLTRTINPIKLERCFVGKQKTTRCRK